MTDEQAQKPEPDSDTLDIFAALIHIWIALSAIQKTLPEVQAQSVAASVNGLADVMAKLMKRHDIKVSIDDKEEGEHE